MPTVPIGLLAPRLLGLSQVKPFKTAKGSDVPVQPSTSSVTKTHNQGDQTVEEAAGINEMEIFWERARPAKRPVAIKEAWKCIVEV